MTEFEAQVLVDLSVLKSQMSALFGDGNSGRIASIEGRVDQHEQSLQRAKASPWQQERFSRWFNSSSNCCAANSAV